MAWARPVRCRGAAIAVLLVGGCDAPPLKGTAQAPSYPTYTCELMAVVQLDGPGELAPNGRTGAELLAGIPAAREWTVRWGANSDVHIDGASEAPSVLRTSFSVPDNPVFEYEDYELVEGPRAGALQPAPRCDDVVVSYVDLALASDDGVLDEQLEGVRVQMTEVLHGFEYWLHGYPVVDDNITLPQLVVSQPPEAGEPWGVRLTLDLGPPGQFAGRSTMRYWSGMPGAWTGAYLATFD